MKTEAPQIAIAKESGRVALLCKYLPVTNHRGSRITVKRWDSPTYGKDPHKLTVSWDYSLNVTDNYLRAVQEYLNRANWRGLWVTSLTDCGAVAVFSPSELD
jgi:hypothetical protein